jgi:hypothetical protein
MAKRNKPKVVPMESPESYIRHRARSLPIAECWVSEKWESKGMAYVYVARKHKSGNLTVGGYLVDLYCFGLKDTMYFFNINPKEFKEILDGINEAFQMEKVEYVLAHNIIYAGIEYADDLGFKPAKEFRLTHYILEEDNEEIEMLDIECGYNGKPLIDVTMEEDPVKAAKLISMLEKKVGKGNYYTTEDLPEDFLDDEFDDDFNDDFDEEFLSELLLNTKTFQFKIKLRNVTNPMVWRRILVPSFLTFTDFHYVLQIAFGWENAHLFQFSPKGYGSSPIIKNIDEYDEGDRRNKYMESDETRLFDIFVKEKQKFVYIYDFGDDWTHEITLEKIHPEITIVPLVKKGQGQSPPEDCGGPWGFQTFKEAISDRKHPEHKHYKEWYGANRFDADAFDLNKVNKALSEFIKQLE